MEAPVDESCIVSPKVPCVTLNKPFQWPHEEGTNILKGDSPEYGTLSWLFDHVVLFVLRQNFGEAEIPDLHPQLALHQDVPRCQVSVDVALARQVLHTL